MRAVRVGMTLGAAMAPLVALADGGGPRAGGQVAEGLTVAYRCEGGVAVTAAYINTPAGESYAVVLHDGTLTPMKAGPTGSGVRYVSLAGPGLVWHTKGDGGFLARDDAGETLVAGDCVAG